MKRLFVAVVLAVFITIAVAEAANTPGLVVTKFYFKGHGPVDGSSEYNWYGFAGTLENRSQQKYSYALIQISVIDNETKEKTQIVYKAMLENLHPGDKCQWEASPWICIGREDFRRKRYVGRIDKITGIAED
jgi:hypothetical protein